MTEMTRISTDIPKTIESLVTKYKEQTGISKSRIITDALKEFLKGKVKEEEA